MSTTTGAATGDDDPQLTPLHISEEHEARQPSEREMSAQDVDEERPLQAGITEASEEEDASHTNQLPPNDLHHQDDDDDTKDHRCFRCCKMGERCPRTFWFFSGIIFPLWLLIFVSSFLGFGLATLEAPKEIELNNARLRNSHRLEAVEQSTRKIIAQAPTLCLRIYVARAHNFTSSSHFELLVTDALGYSQESSYQLAAEIDELLELIEEEYNASIDLVDNLTEAFLFLDECGQNISDMVDDLQNPNASLILGNETSIDFGDLTFNWNRCANGTNTTIIDLPWFQERTYESYHPEAQKQHYEDTWQRDMRRLYDQAFEDEHLPENATTRETVTANANALRYATEHATGQDSCSVNVPAGCWFFFTVMTTIGYGNQAPETAPGQAMLYTLGFLSILLFAGVALRAGNITVCLFEDFMEKGGLKWLNRPFLAPIFWGALYYMWLFFIGLSTKSWKMSRMDEELTFDQGYWFAYISTTTVGLGDIFLEPEVLVTEDLMFFSFVFLIGFVFLASFLEKLRSLVQRNDHMALSHLKQSLANTRICCGKEVIEAGQDLGASVVVVGQALVNSPQAATESLRNTMNTRKRTDEAAMDTPRSTNGDAGDCNSTMSQ